MNIRDAETITVRHESGTPKAQYFGCFVASHLDTSLYAANDDGGRLRFLLDNGEDVLSFNSPDAVIKHLAVDGRLDAAAEVLIERASDEPVFARSYGRYLLRLCSAC